MRKMPTPDETLVWEYDFLRQRPHTAFGGALGVSGDALRQCVLPLEGGPIVTFLLIVCWTEFDP
jgi:hypothetical protein